MSTVDQLARPTGAVRREYSTTGRHGFGDRKPARLAPRRRDEQPGTPITRDRHQQRAGKADPLRQAQRGQASRQRCALRAFADDAQGPVRMIDSDATKGLDQQIAAFLALEPADCQNMRICRNETNIIGNLLGEFDRIGDDQGAYA